MKKIILTISLALACSSVFCQTTVEKKCIYWVDKFSAMMDSTKKYDKCNTTKCITKWVFFYRKTAHAKDSAVKYLSININAKQAENTELKRQQDERKRKIQELENNIDSINKARRHS